MPWPQTATPATSAGATPVLSSTSRMMPQLASHISSMSRSIKPGLGVSIRVSRLATPISLPFASYSAAFVVVPPLSRPMKYFIAIQSPSFFIQSGI